MENFRVSQKIYMGIKRILDFLFALVAFILLCWLFLILCIAIKIDDPGPILFKQKRVGIHKKYFSILKFRTMKTSTPKDMPTHMLENPDQYITRVGSFLRKSSLDELPQIFNILAGQMSIVGPRPALWNQYDLIEERDKYGANDVVPGLTGWAQVNGRDELEIPVKAKLDGYYVEHFGFGMDVRCFFKTITAVLSHEGVVEGGTGEMKKKEER
jgi:O-antigen biosynthesis protein WbqP